MRVLRTFCCATALLAGFASQSATLRFDGNNDYLIMNPFSALASSELTVEFWMRGDVPVKSFTTVLSYSAGGDHNHFFIDIRDARQTLGIRMAGGAVLYVPADTADTNWHHLALSWRSSDGQTDVYLDGGLLITTNGLWQGAAPLANGSFVVGQDQDSFGGGFDPNQAYGGRLDELRFWNVYRSQGEIQALMHRRLTGDEPGLEAYYPFENGGGNLFTDHSGHGWRAIGSGVLWDTADDGTATPIPFLPTISSVEPTGAVVRAPVNRSAGPTTNAFEWGPGSDAMNFDQTDQILIDPAPDLANRSFSFEFWAKRPGSGEAMFPFSLGTSGTRSLLHAGWRDGDDMTFAFFTDDLNVRADIDDSDWHHWAFTYDTNTMQRRIYLDGIQVGQGTAGGNFVGTGPLRLGRYQASNSDLNFEGYLDEVRIWQDVVLDPATIREWKERELDSSHPDYASLAGYWPFSEPGGREVLDASGNGFDGVYVEYPVRVKGARPVFTQTSGSQVVSSTNYALNLDGVDDYVDVPEGVWFNGADNFTIESRVFVRSHASYSKLIDFGTGAGPENVVLALTSGTSGQFYFAVVKGGANQNLISPVTVPLNEWVHLAATWSNGVASLYLNGVRVISGPVHAPNPVTRTKNYIGEGNYSGDAASDALLDFVRIWNVARTPAELAQYQESNVAPGTPGLILNYQFDQGAGSLAVDTRTSSPQDGTLINSPTWQPLSDEAVLLTNLNPGTVYHVRSVASNVNGAGAGPPVQFATQAPQRGTALEFDGVDDYVRVPGLDAEAPLTEVTVELWQRVHAQKAQSTFSLDPDVSANRMQAHIPWSSGTVYWDFGNISGAGRFTYVPSVPLLGEWNHFAFVSSQAGGYMRIYRNGVLEAQKAGMDPRELGVFDLILGRSTVGGLRYLDGELDEVRVWNLARSEEDIRRNMNVRLADATPGLVAHLRLDEGGGIVVNDSSGNEQLSQGLLIGRPAWSDSGAPIGIPLATTAPATQVAEGSATLNGTVNPESTLPTRYWFEYGVEGGFGSSTPESVLPADTALVPVSTVVSGLGISPSYRYRLVVANDNGTNYGSVQSFVMPVPSARTALRFDGVNDQVVVGSSSAYKATSGLTIEAWIFPTGPGSTGSGIIVNKEGEYEFARYSDGTLRWALAIGSPRWTWINTGVVAPLNQWMHVALTYDQSFVRLYTNGVPASTIAATGLIGDAVTGQNELRIGGRQGTSQFFEGALDDVRVWTVARTAGEIAASYNRPLEGDESGLAAYFQFDEGVGTTTANEANGLTATVYGGPTWILSGAGVIDPVVTTLPPAPVLATTATLRGTVNPSGDATLAFFQYGPTIAYGHSVQVGGALNGLQTYPLSSTLTNLEPGTTYHYRMVGYNAFTTNYGADQVFNTLVLGCGWPLSTKVTTGESLDPVHVLDPEGNTYVAGLFSGTASFLSSLEAGDAPFNAFVGRISRGGDWVSAVAIPTDAAGTTRIRAISVDSARHIYVAGDFSGTNTFGSTVLVSNGDTNLFVAKLDPTGTNWLWAVETGGAGADAVRAMTVAGTNGVIVAGQFSGTADFAVTNLVSVPGTDVFVARLAPDGNWSWAQSAGGGGSANTANAITLDSINNIYVAGAFQETAAFGPFNLVSDGGSDLFVAKLSPGGTWVQARRGGSANNDVATGLTSDANQIYLAGQFGGTANYGTSLNNLNVGGVTNVFVMKLNTEASVIWYAQGGAGVARGVAVDGNGRLYLSGDFSFSSQFGALPPLISAGNRDVFLTQLDALTGSWLWSVRVGSSGSEVGSSVDVDASGSVVFSGTYQNTIEIGYVALSTPNDRDIFVARIDADRVYEHNDFVIGEAIPVPAEAQDPGRTDGGGFGQPIITILEKEHPDSDALNSFVWSPAEHKLFAVRPVTALLKWPLTPDVTNTTSVATCVGRARWPDHPQIHVANAPTELEPDVPGFPLNYLGMSFSTIPDASVDAGSKVFNASEPGWTVLQFLNTGGNLPNPLIHPSVFEVAQTVEWNDPEHLIDNQTVEIGRALTHPSHDDPTGKNGHVYFEHAFVDMVGNERAYNRPTRTGPILPVNRDTPAADDDLVIIWYATSLKTGIGWPTLPVRYLAQWPADAAELVLASGIGSGVLDPVQYPNKRVYNQPDAVLGGYNPNEEHAALFGDVLYALRNDLNAIIGVSESYTLLKYRDPGTLEWVMEAFKVVTTNDTFQFAYPAEAGQPLLLPAPLNLLPLCGDSNQWVSGPGYQDYLGRLYARAAGAENNGATVVARYWYPLQTGYFYDLDLDGTPDATAGACIPWLDLRPGGAAGTPVDVVYDVNWPTDVPTLQIGETLFGAKLGLPDLRNFARAEVVYDGGDPGQSNSIESLVRLFDPLTPRVLQLRSPGDEDFLTGPGYAVFEVADPDSLFADVATANNLGNLAFVELPFVLRSRLEYDPLNKNLIFSGLLDESQTYGGPDNPLLLLNVLSPREVDRIKQLNLDPTFEAMVDALYDLTRNPNQLDIDNDGTPDQALLVGLMGVLEDGEELPRFVPEPLGDVPKILTAGLADAAGYITVAENDAPGLGGLPVTLHVIRVEDGPFRGDLKVIQSDNVFDEKLTLRHSADFGGEPQKLEFEWYSIPVGLGVDPTVFPSVLPNGDIEDLNGWTRFAVSPDGFGVNDITLGDGSGSSLLVLSDNYFVCRYRGYVVDGATNWSDWVGIIGGGRAQLAEGWVKRVRDGLNPFEARTADFHANESSTFASMIQQAGPRYEGPIAFNPAGGNINSIGLIEAYETVLQRAKRLSIEAFPPVDYQPANDALLLAAGFIADLYMLLGNEAFADAADPTIGFRSTSTQYGTLAPSIFTFQNQLDSLLEEETALLRGRDDSAASVRTPPVYNRLFWNFTRDEGEVAYAQAYNVTDQNSDGFIDETDARIMFPQSHGDAWGHYLTASKTYYDLLQNPYFEWIPRTEPILLAGVPVEVDYLDERKFARIAAAKAKTGAEIVDLTYRLNYVDDPEGQYQGYKDTDPDRAWGVSEWGHRAGSAAFFDWVTANAILPSTDPNTNHTGLTKIDRMTVDELDEIIAGYESVQMQLDKADEGLNPLGLAKNVVPFDIDPSQIDAGNTHFEQIYDRAIEAVENTVTVFDHANQLSQAIRRLQDTVNDFTQNAIDQERDYKNRLIEIFGLPYAGDIGPGKTYPSGYDGPDLYHYMYVETTRLTGETAPPDQSVEAFFTRLGSLTNEESSYIFPDDFPPQANPNLSAVYTVDYPYSTADFGFTAPAAWGQRIAPGDLQLALSELLQSEARLKQALLAYDSHLALIEDEIDLLEAQFDLRAETIRIRNRTRDQQVTLALSIAGARAVQRALEFYVDSQEELTSATIEGLPKVVGLATDATAPVRASIKFASTAASSVWKGAISLLEGGIEAQFAAVDALNDQAELEIDTAGFEYELAQALKEIEAMIREEAILRAEAFTLAEKVRQNAGNYQATLARGLRLVDERVAYRKAIAAETQATRYQDMTFRIFRNDAIQKYRAQFDLAAQYVFLAAVAYDYETQLLGGRPGAGRAFLTDIVRQRALGEVINGVPVAGRHGLADPLARLSQNFAVLKGQLGFNNPQTETGRFSLRSELFRLRDSSDEAWRAELKKHIVPNLWDVPEFRRYCRPFAPESAGPQPGLIIRFPTTVTFGLNYFGWPLGGGDSAYDSSQFATKVRSAGIWFSDYNGSGLSQTPRVYLVPAGADVLRSPSSFTLETREWRVVDQKIPVPFPIGFSSLNDPTWIPMNDSLSDTFAEIRQFSRFRAYHDSGVFDPAETISDSRLIGRSVWNTDWMLIIPGGTFLFDPEEGLDTFIASVSDIKIFFQTYAYSGN